MQVFCFFFWGGGGILLSEEGYVVKTAAVHAVCWRTMYSSRGASLPRGGPCPLPDPPEIWKKTENNVRRSICLHTSFLS